MPRLPIVPALLASTLALSSGCELLEQFEDGGGIVDLFAGHHGTPRDGQFPEHPGDHFEVTNDQGWTIVVVDAYVTTTAATLNRCDGETLATDFYWGSLCEDLIGNDRQAQGIGAVMADAGKYCSATLSYGPLTEPDNGNHATDADVLGATAYLSGVAKKGDVSVPFEFQTFERLDVEVDLSAVENGGPLELDHDQMFNEQITFTKTYDRFFDGIDFSELDSYDIDALLLDTLEFETTAVRGTDIMP